MLITIKLACLFLGAWWTFINLGKMYYKEQVPSANIFVQMIGVVGFIILQFKLYQ